MSRTVRTQGRGFTIVELLVVVAIIALLIALLLPAIAKARDTAQTNQSRGNITNISKGMNAYAADYNDSQPTFCPGDWGSLPGCGSGCGCSPQQACQNYQVSYGCTDQMILGYSAGGGIWGYWVNGPNCGFSVSTTCSQNACVYVPICFTGGDGGFGSFRIPNIKKFAGYVEAKYYGKVWFAPKDIINLNVAAKYFEMADEFTYDGSNIAFSTYCFSPANMWDPAVFGGSKPCEAGFKSPNGGSGAACNPNAYKSPTWARAKFSSLKTSLMEHTWCQNPPPQITNPCFAGGNTEWYFNQGYNSVPVGAFIDGSVRAVGMWKAMDDDKKASQNNNQGCGLWLRDTPWGTNGYFGQCSYDFLVSSSIHILTRGGITGRDVLATGN